MTKPFLVLRERVFACLCCLIFIASGAASVRADDVATARLAYLSGNYEEALKTLIPAAEAGDANAQNIVGIAFENGNGVEKDVTKALEWYEKSVAQGFVKAQVNLGTMLREAPDGIPQDYPRAAKLFEAAMAQDFPFAFWERGRMYEQGEAGPVDYPAAIKLYERGLELGNGESGNALAQLYRKGQGVEKDEPRARALYAQAAQTGYKVALGNLAHSYEIGMGGNKDALAAYALYHEAVVRGDGNAAVNLAHFMLTNKGYWTNNAMAGAYCLLGLATIDPEQLPRVTPTCAEVDAMLSPEERSEAARIHAEW